MKVALAAATVCIVSAVTAMALTPGAEEVQSERISLHVVETSTPTVYLPVPEEPIPTPEVKIEEPIPTPEVKIPATEGIAFGVAYWRARGQVVFPNIEEVSVNACIPEAIGCAWTAEDTGTCYVWFGQQRQTIWAHEVSHCLGFSHIDAPDYFGVLRTHEILWVNVRPEDDEKVVRNNGAW